MSYGHRPGRSGGNSSATMIFHVLVVVLLILFVINTFYLTSISSALKERVEEGKESARPAMLDVIRIEGPSCDSCDTSFMELGDAFNISSEKSLDYEDAEAQELIEQYNIDKLPALIVTGELEKSGLASRMQEVDEALVAMPAAAPYIDLSGMVRGLIDVTYIVADDCDDCFDITQYTPILSQQFTLGGVTELSEADASALIERYSLEVLPVMIIGEEAKLYPEFVQSWQNVGEPEADGSYVLREPNPPFKDLETQEVKGLVTITYLVDDSCENCYDPVSHNAILQGRLGVYVAANKTVEITSPQGQALLEQHSITAVPTVVLSKEISDYQLEEVLGQVGDFDDEGVFVFRDVQVMGNYYDLEKAEFVDVEAEFAAQQAAAQAQ